MIRVGMSTSSTFPKSVDASFRIAKQVGFDGIEIMVTTDRASQSEATLRALSRKHDLPILSIHAPVLLFTQFVWGTNAETKLRRSVDLAVSVGASTVVVHPPFRWQHEYSLAFLDLVRELEGATGVAVAVENMFPWRVSGRPIQAYAPSSNPLDMDCDSITIDFSHAGLSSLDALKMIKQAGRRLKHVHLTDGQAPGEYGRVLDEHLIPGEGGQPVAESLQWLRDTGWQGDVVAEVNTRSARSETQRLQMLRRTLAFARLNLGPRGSGAAR